MSGAYYNDHDPYVCAWLRNLIAAGLIPPGDVDERSILEVAPDDVRGYTQCHFFAGLGGWGYALRRAGWPDDRPIWTGSAPCQPFSVAGMGLGYDDARHLAPAFLGLVAECCPPVVAGEQVASAAGRGWLADLRAALEGLGYALGAADLCSAGVGGAHIRQRLYWGAVRLADAGGQRRQQDARGASRHEAADGRTGRLGREPDGNHQPAGDGTACGLDHAPSARHVGPLGGAEVDPRDEARLRVSREGRGAGGLAHGLGARLEGHAGHGDGGHEPGRLDADEAGSVAEGGDAGRVEHAHRAGSQPGNGHDAAARHRLSAAAAGGHGWPCAPHGGWANADWLFCRDGKWRPVEPGTFPLADAIPARVGRLRAYGNAIDPEVAATFLGAFMEAAA